MFYFEGFKVQFNKQNCIVDKSLKIIKLIKISVRLILDNFGIVGFLVFGHIPVDSFWYYFEPKIFCFEGFKAQF